MWHLKDLQRVERRNPGRYELTPGLLRSNRERCYKVMRCNKISAFYLYYNHTGRTNKIFKGLIFGNTNNIYTFAETKPTGGGYPATI